MYRKLILNDIKRSKAVTLITVLFIAAAALLVSLAATLAGNLSGAIDALMTRAATPHFMQMHSGDIDRDRLAAFAGSAAGVAAYQTLEFLNIDGAEIILGGESLADGVQDNGLSVQSGSFDFLLDLDGEAVSPGNGQLYVPVSYRNLTSVGDRASICGRDFVVAGFLRDSQMNSLLASSKRFLVSESDYRTLAGKGSVEYLIEFRLDDMAGLGGFEAAYAAAGLEANGPTLTYPLFRMMNAMSDGLMIALILLVSALVVVIAFLCVRFTLLAKIEDEYREIGVMKAIGLRVADIRRLYLAKYMAVAAAGCIIGYAFSFLFRGALLESIRLNFGESGAGRGAAFFELGGVLLVFIAVTAYVNGVLRRFKSISAAEAVRFGASQDKARGARASGPGTGWIRDMNLLLGVKDVLARKKLYATMLVVFALSMFIIIVPRNLHSTISSAGFCRYMGIGASDLRVDVQQVDDPAARAADIADAMAADPAIAAWTVLSTKAFTARLDDGSGERVKVELGDHAAFPVEYSSGRAPSGRDDIALSVINARELGRKVGDALVLEIGGRERALTVCGVYSDVTNGGKTAKAAFDDGSAAVMWSVVNAALADGHRASDVIGRYADAFPYAKVSDLERYIDKTFGPTIDGIGKAALVAVLMALGVSALVTLLFMRLLLARDRYSIGVLKAIGFTNRDLAAQYMSRVLFVLVVGMVLGTALAGTAGEALAGAVIAAFGASSFRFEADPLLSYVLSPLAMAAAVALAASVRASGAGRIMISESIKE